MTPTRARLRRAVLAPVRPLVRFFDVRFQHLEDRFPALERRVGADVESMVEFHALVTRSLARIERRLDDLEARLDAGRAGGDRPDEEAAAAGRDEQPA